VIVLDASALLDFLLALPDGVRVTGRLEEETVAHAPHLVDTEVASALRRWVQRGSVAEPRAAEALEDLAELRLVRYPHAPLWRRVWALRERFSAYDATYVALAEALGATLLTSDGHLARAASGLLPVVDMTP
jgi:predicted nucleic acid-binding protein